MDILYFHIYFTFILSPFPRELIVSIRWFPCHQSIKSFGIKENANKKFWQNQSSWRQEKGMEVQSMVKDASPILDRQCPKAGFNCTRAQAQRFQLFSIS